MSISQGLAEYLQPHVKESLFLDLSLEHGIIQSKPSYLLQIPLALTIKERIVSLLKRVPASNAPATLISPRRPLTGDRIIPAIGIGDVYLFPTGKAALYRLHNYLTVANDHEYVSVAFGRVSQSMLDILAVNGALRKHFANGDDNDLADLKALCVAEAAADRRVQAVYVEMSSASAFENLRSLADTHGFVLIVIDPAANFASVDLMSIADVLVANLAGGFSGNPDILGGSVVLNPDSNVAYRHLKPLMERYWCNEVFAGDIVKLEHSSCDYLRRSAIRNQNAEAIATFLVDKVGKSSVTRVNYPKFFPGFEVYMRNSTGKSVPGYSCLVDVEFEEQDCAVAFCTALKMGIQKFPSSARSTFVVLEDSKLLLGGDIQTRRDWSVHVVAGLESTENLVSSVEQALKKATEEIS